MRAGWSVHEFTVVSNESVADGLMRIVMSSPELAGSLLAGQFVNVAVPGDASQILRIPLSFSHSDARAGTVEIVYAVVGDGIAASRRWRRGDRSTAVGPAAAPGPPCRPRGAPASSPAAWA